MKQGSIIFIIFLSVFQISNAQELYEESYATLKDMLRDSTKYSFRKAVFSVENAYMDGAMDTAFVNGRIRLLASFARKLAKKENLKYEGEDREIVTKHAAIFSVLKDSIIIKGPERDLIHLPYSYNFEDPMGQKDWKNMFVSKLLATRKGNCHSLPYLYIILAEELGVNAYLALAPRHMYIKIKNNKNGWYNTELTSGTFPLDAWLMASGYIHLDAITNSVYMKALNKRENLALCLVDLAQGYERKFPDHNGKFMLECSELALQYFPNYINALLVRVEALRIQINHFLAGKKADFPEAIPRYPETVSLYNEIEKEVNKIHELGYREMPEGMYRQWLNKLKGK